jgi:hypothetical protein
MSNEGAETVPGAVRFGKAGYLEIFDGTDWTPLQRASDADLPPVMRNIPAGPLPAPDDAGGAEGQAPT